MAKKTATQKIEQDAEILENAQPEQTDSDRKRAKRGSTLSAQIKIHFLEIMAEFATSGQVNKSTLENAIPVFEQVPVTATVGMPPEVQLANIETTIAEMFESKNIDQNELRKLLNRKARLERLIKTGELDESESD